MVFGHYYLLLDAEVAYEEVVDPRLLMLQIPLLWIQN